MKAFFSKITSTAASAVLVLIGLAMAGLGLTVVGVLALFAMAAVGLAILAAPFVKAGVEDAREVEAPLKAEADPA